MAQAFTLTFLIFDSFNGLVSAISKARLVNSHNSYVINSAMFFPIFKALNLDGFLELAYTPANNWENRESRPMNIYALWSDGHSWSSEFQGVLKRGEIMRITSSSLKPKMLETGICLLYPTIDELAPQMDLLPRAPYWFSNVPEWRCTSGLSNECAQTSYQAEIYPLPSKASMLTFHPFIQFNKVDNYLLILNITNEPTITTNEIELFNSTDLRKYGSASVRTNSASVIPLDVYGFTADDLPLFLSRKMAGIPFGLGVAKDGSMLSLEHTHPPASLVLFGNRNQIQSKIKKSWLQRIGEFK